MNRDVVRRVIVALTLGLGVAAWLRTRRRGVTEPRAYAAVLHHVGRRSGTPYATGLRVQETAEGFVVPLPYGESTDWCQNLRAAGTGRIEHKGESLVVVDPQVIDLETAAMVVGWNRSHAWRGTGAEQFLTLRKIAEMPTLVVPLEKVAVPA
ncbi:MAG TPA: nitroreductase family deazaflavin-dependent oxidoreductase [Candidatus Limnocylindrales bacterium]|nr:nitroreductase family deazaflavin-dependent oxidoreductase [Candidatus Limnocylindrales bacterium]